MDYRVHGVAKSQTRLSDFHFQETEQKLESKTQEPGRLS